MFCNIKKSSYSISKDFTNLWKIKEKVAPEMVQLIYLPMDYYTPPCPAFHMPNKNSAYPSTLNNALNCNSVLNNNRKLTFHFDHQSSRRLHRKIGFLREIGRAQL
jgi:hypothetical protein